MDKEKQELEKLQKKQCEGVYFYTYSISDPTKTHSPVVTLQRLKHGLRECSEVLVSPLRFPYPSFAAGS